MVQWSAVAQRIAFVHGSTAVQLFSTRSKVEPAVRRTWRASVGGQSALVPSAPTEMVPQCGYVLTGFALQNSVFLTLLVLVLGWVVLRRVQAYRAYRRSLRDATALADSNSEFETVNGLKLHLKMALPTGPDEATFADGMVLFHGFGASLFSFRDVAQPLADATGMRVLSFDLPGFGLTQRPSSGFQQYSATSDARLGLALAEQRGLEELVLCGHSFGALVACITALLQPRRVRAVVLIAPAVPPTNLAIAEALRNTAIQLVFTCLLSLWRTVLRILWFLLVPVLAAVLRAKLTTDALWATMIRFAFFEKGKVTSQVVGGYSRPNQVRDWDRGVLSFTWSQLGASRLPSEELTLEKALYDDLSKLQIPTLIIHGEQDGIVPVKIAESVAARLSGARFVVVPNCGHLPHEELPAAVVESISAFLDDSEKGISR